MAAMVSGHHQYFSESLLSTKGFMISFAFIAEEESRAELHEMLVPAALRKPWTEVENSTCFSCYYIEFCPTPADREYREFGLFVKEPLPEEAGKMKIDLCLARGRMVKSQLISTGVAKFDKDEVKFVLFLFELVLM